MEVPQELKSRYIERRKNDLLHCLDSLEKNQFVEIEKIGHQLKGNGTTFGLPQFSKLGLSIEQAAKAHDFSELEKRLKDFSNLLDEISN